MRLNESWDTFAAWFERDTNWSRTGFLPAAGMLALAPVVRRRLDGSLFLVYLQLPIYMLHQYEEHGHGAFKAYVNRLRGVSANPVTDRQIFWINVLGVWVLDPVVLGLAARVNRAAGLVAPYVSIVNAITHVLMAFKRREYNPGLGTSVGLLLPAGAFAAVTLSRENRLAARDHRRALAVAILLHVVIFTVLLDGGKSGPGDQPS